MLELAAQGDFASRVADFYRRRGYTVHENTKVRGASGRVYPMRMVAEGGLGALAVSFGDAAGADEHEVALVRGLARDIGATPVLACPQPSHGLLRIAAQLAVVVLDEQALLEPAPPTPAATIRSDLESHPWPTSGRADASAAAWPSGTSRAVEVDEWIDTLTKKTPAPDPAIDPAPFPEPPAPTPPAPEPVPEDPHAAFDWLNAPDIDANAPQLVVLEHASTLEAKSPATASVLEVEIPPAILARAAAAESAYARLVWVKRIAYGGLGLLGLFIVWRYVLGL